jgi:hypothetical protein
VRDLHSCIIINRIFVGEQKFRNLRESDEECYHDDNFEGDDYVNNLIEIFFINLSAYSTT